MRIENLETPESKQAWVEISAPVRYVLHQNPVHLSMEVNTDLREVSFGQDGGIFPSASDPTSSEPGLDDPALAALDEQIRLIENQATRLDCADILWQHQETNEVQCLPHGNIPDGAFVFIGPSPSGNLAGAQAIANELRLQAEELRRELALLSNNEVGDINSQEQQNAGPLPCNARVSRIVPNSAVPSPKGGQMLSLRCGSVQTYGNAFSAQVTIPADLFNVSDGNYSGSGTYHKLHLYRVAQIVRGGGIQPSTNVKSYELPSATDEIDLGVLLPGFYRLELAAWQTPLAESWLLVTVDERPGSLSVKQNSELQLVFDAPPLTPTDNAPWALPRYEIDVIQMRGEGPEQHQHQLKGAVLDTDVVPGRPINVPSWMQRPGTNLFKLVINDGEARYLIDALALEIGQSERVRRLANLTLNGVPANFEADLLLEEGYEATVEIRAGEPLDPYRGKAVFRIERLADKMTDRPTASASLDLIGELVIESSETRLRRMTVFPVPKNLTPGRYAASVALNETGQTWHLFFRILPKGEAKLTVEGGPSFRRGQNIIVQTTVPQSVDQPRTEVFRLGEYVPGCAFRMDQRLDINRIDFRIEEGKPTQLSLTIPGLYLLRTVLPLRGGEPKLAETGIEVREDQGNATWRFAPGLSPRPVTAQDRLEAPKNPWSGEGGIVSGQGCSDLSLPDEEIELSLTELRDNNFSVISGPARYGHPYYLEGQLEQPARKPSYLAKVALPGGGVQEVRLYRLEDQPDKLRSEIVYFIWEEGEQ